MKKAVLALVAVVPLWIVEFPPIQDLPNHVGRVHVLIDLLRGGAAFSADYRLELLPFPNLAGDLILAPLMLVFPGAVAGKLLLSATLLLTAYAGFRFLRAAGAKEMGWLGLALLWNWFLFMGFLSFAISVPLALLAFAWRIRHEDDWIARRQVVFALLATATYLGHLFSFCLLVTLVQARKARRGGLRRLLLLEPGFLPGFACWAVVLVAGMAEGGGPGWIGYQDPEWKLASLANLFLSYSPAIDVAVFAAVVAGVALATRRVRWRRLGTAAGLFVLFLALPRSALDGYWVDARVLPFLAWFLLAGLEGEPGRARGIGVALLLLTSAWTGAAFLRLGPELGRIVHAADRLPRGATVLPLTEKELPGEVEVYHHLVIWTVSRRDTVTPHLFAKRFQHPVRAIHGRTAPHEYWFKGQGDGVDFDRIAKDWEYVWLTGPPDGTERRVSGMGTLRIEEGPLRIYELERTR